MTWSRGPKRPQGPADSVRATAANRLRLVGSGEVMTWAEQAVNAFHESLDTYRSHKDRAALEELRKAVSMLSGAVDVMEERDVV